jgi:putative polyhydroxyalkanoate system protein
MKQVLVFGAAERYRGWNRDDRAVVGIAPRALTRRPETKGVRGEKMSDIKIRRSHSMPHDKARHAAEKMAKRLQKEFNLDYEWDGDVLVFERTGVNGELTVAPKHVEMEVKLGFLLRMMKPTIEKHINENLDEIFAEHVKAKPKKA